MSDPYKHDANAIIARLMAVENASDAKVLEASLINKGYGGRNLVTNWQTRGHVSQQFLETYSARERINLDWLVHGRGSRSATKNRG